MFVGGLLTLSKSNVQFEKALLAMEQPEEHVIKDGNCIAIPCYALTKKPREDVRIFTKL